MSSFISATVSRVPALSRRPWSPYGFDNCAMNQHFHRTLLIATRNMMSVKTYLVIRGRKTPIAAGTSGRGRARAWQLGRWGRQDPTRRRGLGWRAWRAPPAKTIVSRVRAAAVRAGGRTVVGFARHGRTAPGGPRGGRPRSVGAWANRWAPRRRRQVEGEHADETCACTWASV